MFIFDGKLFKKERIKQEITYGEFARRLQKHEPKASKSIIVNWEKGAIPSAKYLIGICDILDKKPKEFIRIATPAEEIAMQKRLKERRKQPMLKRFFGLRRRA